MTPVVCISTPRERSRAAMTTIMRDATHCLRRQENLLVDESGVVFDTVAYSRFKYGHKPTAVGYGLGLARRFIRNFPDLALSERHLLVASAPYKFLPNASHTIAETFTTALNSYRVMRGFEPAMALHLVRYKMGTDGYATSTPEERKYTLSQAALRHVDANLVRDSIVIAIDDVRITGSTQDRIEELLYPCDPFAVCFLHVARLDEEQANAEAGIENLMNKRFSTTLATIAVDIDAGEFQLNARVFRTIIEWDDLDALSGFLMQRSDAFLGELYAVLVSSTLEMYQRKPDGTRVLKDVIVRRKLTLAQFLSELQRDVV